MGNGKINNQMIIYSFQVNGRENWTAVTSESAAEAIIVPCLQNEVLKRKIIKKIRKGMTACMYLTQELNQVWN